MNSSSWIIVVEKSHTIQLDQGRHQLIQEAILGGEHQGRRYVYGKGVNRQISEGERHRRTFRGVNEWCLSTSIQNGFPRFRLDCIPRKIRRNEFNENKGDGIVGEGDQCVVERVAVHRDSNLGKLGRATEIAQGNQFLSRKL